jgi:hypothetical protein
MYQKQKELAMMNESCAKIYIIEIKTVSFVFAGQGDEGKREIKNEADIL